MGGFIRKVAGAFISFEDAPHGPVQALENTQVEQIEFEPASLLEQLRSARPTLSRPFAEMARVEQGAMLSGSVMELTADQVFATAGIADSPNSAQRVLTLVAALAVFPREQQLHMLRALDQTDDTWSEPAVLEDAQHRQTALRSHLQAIDAEKKERLQRVTANAEAAQGESRRALEAIDRQIIDLQQRREQTIARATAELSDLQHQRHSVEEAAERARRGIASVNHALSELVAFFASSDSPRSAGKS